MLKILYSAALLMVLSSCANDSKNDLQVFRLTEESLDRSNQSISTATRMMLKSFESKINDPQTAAQAMAWQPKATKVSAAASTALGFIADLRKELKDATGYKKNTTGDVFQDDNLEGVNKVLIKNNKGEELYRKLKAFTVAIDSIDEQMSRQFEEITQSTFYYISKAENEKQFAKAHFNQVSAAAALSLLSKFENDVLNTENMWVAYCYARPSGGAFGMDVFLPLVSQSSTVIKSGEVIEIIAGVGAFSAATQPRIIIDGNAVTTNENGFVKHEYKTATKSGKYTVPVVIQYYKPDGTTETMTRNVTYTVIE